MAQPVWVLSVDLQTKTATFQSGMSDAAKSARGAFKDIKEGAGEMGRETGFSMMEARHSVMILGEEFGVKIPRALAGFVASLGPLGPAMEAAFPLAAIALGATLLIEHLHKIKEEEEKLTQDQVKFGTAVNNTFNALDSKILEAGIRADELNRDHLSALHKQLEMIDRQSMSELVHSFDEVSKAADVVFADLKANWYTFGIGSAGAQNALTKFKTEYDSLLAQGKNKEAADLLKGTRESAQHVLDLQKQALGSRTDSSHFSSDDQKKYAEYVAATNALKKIGVGFTEKEVQSQEALLQALEAQAGVQDRVNALKKLQDDNAKHTTQNQLNDEAFARFKRDAETQKQGLEIEQKQWQEAHDKAVQALQQGEKEKIEVTDKASAERLAAIDAAIQEENKYGLQETSFYLGLLNQRFTEAKAMQDEADKQRAEAGKEAADQAQKMAELALAAEKEQQAVIDSARRMTRQQRIDEEKQFADKEYAIKMTAFAQEIAALDKHDKDYENKLKAIQDKEVQLTQQHENEITAIKDQALKERNKAILDGEQHLQDSIAHGLTAVLMNHETFGAMMTSIGNEVVSGMIQNAIKSMLADDMTKEKDAAAAARKAYLAGMWFPPPANLVLAPAFAAAAFASVMAFEGGGIVPGVGRGDIVPAMLEPGEGVIPKRIMEGYRHSDSAPMRGHTYHVHVRPTYHVNTIDGDGMQAALDKHTDVLQRHFEHTLRRMNR